MKYIVLKTKKWFDKFEIETPKIVFIDEFLCVRSKMYAFECKDETKDKNKLKGISKSQSKSLNFKNFINGFIEKNL